LQEGDLIDDTQPSDGDTKVRRRAVRKDGDGNGEADTHGGAEDDGNSEEDEDDDKTSDNNDKKSKWYEQKFYLGFVLTERLTKF